MCDLLARSGTWERTVIRAELAAEVGVAITEGEYQLLLAESAFGLRFVPLYPPRVSRAIVNAQKKLALCKGRVRAEGGEPAQDPVVAARAPISARWANTDGRNAAHALRACARLPQLELLGLPQPTCREVDIWVYLFCCYAPQSARFRRPAGLPVSIMLPRDIRVERANVRLRNEFRVTMKGVQHDGV